MAIDAINKSSILSDEIRLKAFSDKLTGIRNFLTTKYFEVEDFTSCILLSLLSRTNMIALGQPGIAKSAILREIVNLIDFDDIEETPYFHIQMGADISPNNVFGAPDINYFKKNGIIKRHYKGFLPDAVIAFCSEFYRVNDQVANSGLLTILNEGEFKNGDETIVTKLRFFMADTNFFPKQEDDLDVEESDMKLQALHDRFLARIYVKPLSEDNNKVKMIMMEDEFETDIRLDIHEIIAIQDSLGSIALSEDIARKMVKIASELSRKHHIFISPRRLKLSRNLVKAQAVLSGRTYCKDEDLMALQFSFWQRIEDILVVKETIYSILDKPRKDARHYSQVMDSILDELDRNIENQKDLPTFDISTLYRMAITDLLKLIERIHEEYPSWREYPEIEKVHFEAEQSYSRLVNERNALS